MHHLELPAYAKINLCLNILDKRPDGYHEVVTVLQQIDLADRIVFTAREGGEITFSCEQPEVPLGDDNLCVRAARLLQGETDTQQGIELRLHKKIPMGAGLGGGSSDAAAVLLGLNKLWNLRLGVAELQRLASRLGSDVPFFIEGGTALGLGRGERLRRLHLSQDFVVLIVFPGLAISTAWAYGQANLSLTMRKKNIKLQSLIDKKIVDLTLLKTLGNDLEEVVFQRFSILNDIKRRLYESKATYAGMTGTGSALFGIFHNEKGVLDTLEAQFGDFLTYLARPITWGYAQVV